MVAGQELLQQLPINQFGAWQSVLYQKPSVVFLLAKCRTIKLIADTIECTRSPVISRREMQSSESMCNSVYRRLVATLLTMAAISSSL